MPSQNRILARAEEKVEKLNMDSFNYNRNINRLLKIVALLLFVNTILNLSSRELSINFYHIYFYFSPKEAIPNGLTVQLICSMLFGKENLLTVLLAVITGILTSDIIVTASYSDSWIAIGNKVWFLFYWIIIYYMHLHMSHSLWYVAEKYLIHS